MTIIPRCGDHVLHRPSGETWVVAYAEGEYLAWSGWPDGRAKLADCDLVHRCSNGAHEKAVAEWKGLEGDTRTGSVARIYPYAGRRFPIMTSYIGRGEYFPGGFIPWAMIEAHADQANCNHSQTIQRLAERGGLSWCEAHAVLTDRPWKRMALQEAMTAVVIMVQAWEASS